MSLSNTLAWEALFAKEFLVAEQAARRALKHDPEYTIAITNLALALLFQGKEKDALKMYKEWAPKPFRKEKTFRDVFLSDLQAMEDANINHPLIEKVREMLAN